MTTSTTSAAPESSRPTVCLVEDEPVLRREMAFQLEHHGFAVQTFTDAQVLDRHLSSSNEAATLVLDVGLGDGEDGLSICRRLRRHDPQRGIVFVTARGLRDERLAGLMAGADAYLVKPVDLAELVLVLHRLAQRSQGRDVPAHGQPDDTPRRPWTLDLEGLALVSPEAHRVPLTLAEFQLVRGTVRKPGQPCSMAELCRALGLQPEEWNQHRIEVILSRLRKKVERTTGSGLPVRNLRGEGYVWVGHDDARPPRASSG